MEIRVYADKLRSQMYDSSELKLNDRADLKEGMNEILELVTFSRAEYEQMVVLMNHLVNLHEITNCDDVSGCKDFADSEKWKALAKEFNLKSKALLNFMELYRVYQGEAIGEINADIDANVKSLLDQLRDENDRCQSAERSFYTTKKIFLKQKEMKISMICNGHGQLSAVRQPGDYGDQMPTSIDFNDGNKPRTTFFNSRIVHLKPLDYGISGVSGTPIYSPQNEKSNNRSERDGSSCFFLGCLFK